jgi:NAD(P)H dehydrogenase (quinone)
MNVLIIFAHPNNNSYCSALKQKFLEGTQVNNNSIKIHDLYATNFQPNLTQEELSGKLEEITDYNQILEYQEDIIWAEIICIIYPVWWYGPPAILKGYIDRVLTEGFAFVYKDDQAIPKLTNKKMILIQTFDAEEKMEKEKYQDITFKSMYNIWSYCGISEWERISLFRVSFVSNNQRQIWLENIYNLGEKIGR